jgi:antitoxin VapB
VGLFIKNPETERKARELAALDGATLTGAVDRALEEALARRRAERPVRTLESMIAATERFHAACGGLKPDLSPMTKQDWDDLWPTGIPEIDEA